MSNPYNHIGIECTISYWDSPDTVVYGTILFGNEPDTDDPEDNDVFYYLDETEEAYLYQCISLRSTKCDFGNEWFIDLSDDYALIVKEAVEA